MIAAKLIAFKNNEDEVDDDDQYTLIRPINFQLLFNIILNFYVFYAVICCNVEGVL